MSTIREIATHETNLSSHARFAVYLSDNKALSKCFRPLHPKTNDDDMHNPTRWMYKSGGGKARFLYVVWRALETLVLCVVSTIAYIHEYKLVTRTNKRRNIKWFECVFYSVSISLSFYYFWHFFCYVCGISFIEVDSTNWSVLPVCLGLQRGTPSWLEQSAGFLAASQTSRCDWDNNDRRGGWPAEGGSRHRFEDRHQCHLQW